MQQDRYLAAILFTDIVGYTAMMQQDEQNAVAVTRHYITVLKQLVAEHQGKILNDYGDGNLCSFSSATEAMRCALKIQKQLQSEPAVPLRMGLHVGELFFEADKVMGDGVNVASRIQSLGLANSLLFSKEVFDKLKNQPEFKSVSIGRFQFKNVDEPMEVFALINDGLIVPNKKKMEGKLQATKTSPKMALILSTILLLSFALVFGYRQFLKKTGFTGNEKSIAVLPFETISSEQEDQYINDGFSIDVINKLSKLSGLSTVPGWASVKIFKNTRKSLKEIADELGVAAILTGTIQKNSNKLHITASLFDVNTGKTIWNTDDDRKWDDVLKLQSEVAQKIVSSLSATITPEEQRGVKKQYTENAEAYAYYIKGRYFWDDRTPVSFDSAETNFKKAIELDPKYGLAYAGLADLFIFNQKGLTQREAIPIARDFANKALLLDSTLVEAITTLGFIQSVYDYDWKTSKITIERAINLNPNYAYAHIFYGNLLQYTGYDTEKGIKEIIKATTIDPMSVSLKYVLGRNYYLAGKYLLAEEQLRKIAELKPKFTLAKESLIWVLLIQKKYSEAIELIRQVPEKGISKVDLYRGTLLSYALAVSGNKKAAEIELSRVLKENTENSHTLLAQVYTALNNFKQAFKELEKAFNDREIFLYYIKVDPNFIPIRNEPKFKELLKRMNLQ